MFAKVASLVRNALPTRCRTAFLLANQPHIRHAVTWAQDLPRIKGEGVTLNPIFGDVVNSPEEKWKVHARSAKRYLEDNPPAHTYAGRSVKVKGGNFADAYARLQGILQRNKVQAELRRTERHEKKGVKRRRLSSERWRRQFAHEVRQKVQLVNKIRSRGA